MEDNCRITIIIPLYNAERYLDDLLYSLKYQSNDNFEVIFVNDGSSDTTSEILRIFCNNDIKRYRLFNISNIGVSRARHFGFKQAKGEFVFFIDADDYISLNAIDLLLSYYEIFKSDIIIADYYKFDRNHKLYINSMTDDFNKYSISLFLNKDISFSIWGKLYRRSLLNDLFFKYTYNFNIGEDLLFNLALSTKNVKLSYLKHSIYFYRLRKSSLSSAKFINFDYFTSFRNEYKNILSHSYLDSEEKKLIIKDDIFGIVDIISLPLFYNFTEYLKVTTYIENNKPPRDYMLKSNKLKRLFVFFVKNKYIPRVLIFYFFRLLYKISNYLITKRFYE